jgi:hypothetical protein
VTGKPFPSPRSLDELRKEPTFQFDSADAIVAAIPFSPGALRPGCGIGPPRHARAWPGHPRLPRRRRGAGAAGAIASPLLFARLVRDNLMHLRSLSQLQKPPERAPPLPGQGVLFAT